MKTTQPRGWAEIHAAQVGEGGRAGGGDNESKNERWKRVRMAGGKNENKMRIGERKTESGRGTIGDNMSYWDERK